jgi:alkanesulfonate monooxygenase SsuD/methylene tetrahydromethanopterin reductase-like flavin-dependent oxidoreductase (luciferase family)
VQKALTRAKLAYDGEHFTLPLPDGPGKALHLMLHPVREHIPTYLAAVGPKNLELAGEIADGWLGIFPETEHLREQVGHVATGRAKVGKTLDGFDVCPTIPAAIGDDVQAAGDPIKAYVALYVGGMGSREQNFYNQQARRMGFEAEAENIQELYLTRRQGEAMAAVPFDLVDRTSLVGPVERVADRMLEYVEAGVTTFSIAPFAATAEAVVATLRGVSEAAEKAGLLA